MLNSDRAKTADCIKLFRVIKIKVKCEEMQRTVWDLVTGRENDRRNLI